MKDDLHKYLCSRRSVRSFERAPVPVDVVKRVLKTAIYAPSAHNLQPWRFAVLEGEEAKSRLAKALVEKFSQDMKTDGAQEEEIQKQTSKTIRRINDAPLIIILCRDSMRVNPQPDEKRKQLEFLMATQSVAIAGLQLLLAAHAEGLAGTWICWPLFAPSETRRALDLPDAWDPQGMVFLGYPAETPQVPQRPPIDEITRYL